MVVIITKIKVFYTTVAIMTQTDTFCGRNGENLSRHFLFICIVVGASLLISECIPLILYIDEYPLIHKEVKKITLGIICVLLIIGFGLYLLADNSQPLDCSFGCDISTIGELKRSFKTKASFNSFILCFDLSSWTTSTLHKLLLATRPATSGKVTEKPVKSSLAGHGRP